VLELVRAGAVAYVLVWKLDRFGRSTIDVLSNVEELGRAGVTFTATSQGLEVGPRAGAMGKLTLTVLAAAAELERETISERTLLGLQAAKRKGRKLGRPKGSRDTYRRRRRRASR
jgi:DNA invertase Pin-like site-specific DNA recombinase